MENAVEREGGLLCLNIYEGEEGIKGQWPTVSKAAKYKQEERRSQAINELAWD